MKPIPYYLSLLERGSVKSSESLASSYVRVLLSVPSAISRWDGYWNTYWNRGIQLDDSDGTTDSSDNVFKNMRYELSGWSEVYSSLIRDVVTVCSQSGSASLVPPSEWQAVRSAIKTVLTYRLSTDKLILAKAIQKASTGGDVNWTTTLAMIRSAASQYGASLDSVEECYGLTDGYNDAVHTLAKHRGSTPSYECDPFGYYTGVSGDSGAVYMDSTDAADAYTHEVGDGVDTWGKAMAELFIGINKLFEAYNVSSTTVDDFDDAVSIPDFIGPLVASMWIRLGILRTEVGVSCGITSGEFDAIEAVGENYIVALT